MKYDYKFRIIDLGQSKKDLVIVLPKEIEVVASFLNTEVQGSYSEDWYLEAIDRVLSGDEEYWRVSGDLCILEISRDSTKVIDSCANYGVGNCCEIETDELKALIILWAKELKSFMMQHRY